MKNPKDPASFKDYKDLQHKKKQEATLQDLLSAREHSQHRVKVSAEKFLTAWKRGVTKLGIEYFKLTANIYDINDKWQICPDFDMISRTIVSKSHGQQALLAMMYSFFDPEDGQKLLSLIGIPNFVSARACLDDEGLDIISELWLYHTGW